MAKTMNVNLVFNANTQLVKALLNELKTSLNSLTNTSSLDIGAKNYNAQLQAATGSLSRLKAILNQTTDASGNLNISLFVLQMDRSKLSVLQLQKDMGAFGVEGQKAFLQLSRSVMNALMPVKLTNVAIDKLWGSMKNVATWQISSTVLYGFINKISEAYLYTQDLNESLNNIRIVTGYGTDEMAKFAELANKAAKALSASTLEYTDAALIYYQLGLSGKEVTQRADTTIKLANVARTSGEEASEWMTAIWNNFDNGSKSLEYYADVLTKLGADTASSADEIAGGLEKFSAVANTVGLSYEYAAAALATITALTRQSEDVVGTSLKTLFARIENLSLGDTLDDGTTLNQYSEALYKVGINIKDASGQLKDMDIILNEMGATWGTLSKDLQVALAQTVGGIRQYNQLIALMDNWDFFEKNVDRAKNATGELNKLNDIYAESWEAANKRVKASAEALYSALLKDDFFISLTNGASSALDGITELIDKMGGLKTLLPAIVLLFNKMFGLKMLAGIREFSGNMQLTSKSMKENIANKRLEFVRAQKLGRDGGSPVVSSMQFTSSILQESESKVLAIQRLLTAEAEKAVLIGLDEINNQATQIMLKAELLEKEKEIVEELKKLQLLSNTELNNFKNQKTEIESQAKNATDNISSSVRSKKGKDLSYDDYKSIAADSADLETFRNKVRTELKPIITDLSLFDKATEEAFLSFKKLDSVEINMDKSKKELDETTNKLKTVSSMAEEHEEELDNMKETLEGTSSSFNNSMDKMGQYGWDQAFMGLTNGAMSAAMGISAITSAILTLKSEDASPLEKLTAVLMGFAMAAPLLSGVFKAITKISTATGRATIMTTLDTLATKLNTKAKQDNGIAAAAKRKQSDLDGKENIEHAATEKIDEEAIKAKKRAQGAPTSNSSDMNGRKVKISKTPKNLKGGKFKGGGTAGGGLSMLGSMAVAAVGIAILATSIKLAIDNYNKLEKEAEKANKTAVALRTTAQETQEAYNNMLSASSEYDEGYKGLEKLTKGTNEYKQALLETNAKARELLNTYDDLEYSIDALGAIKIDQDSLIAAQNKEYQKAVAAEAAATSAEQRSRQLENDVAIQKELRSNDYDNTLGEEDTGAVLGASGAAIGGALAAAGIVSMIPIAGWIAGAIVGLTALTAGLITYAMTEEDSTKSEQAAIETLTRHFDTSEKASRATEEEMRKVLEDEGYNEDLIDALLENTDTLLELIETEAKNNELTLKENQLMVKLQMQANGTLDQYDEKAAEYIANIGGANLEFEEDVIREGMSRWGKDGLHKGHSTGGRAQEYAKEYLEAAGITGWKLTDTTGTDSNRKFVFKDENGEEQIKTLEEMKEAIINHKALAKIEENTLQTALLVAKLRTTDLGNALLDYISTGNFDNATGIELEALKNKDLIKEFDINGDNIVDSSELSPIAGSLDANNELEDLGTEGWGTKGIEQSNTGVTKQIQKIANEYLNATKSKTNGWKVIDTYGDDKHRRFVFDTGSEKVEVPLSEMRREVALYRAGKKYQSLLNEDALLSRDKREAIDDDLYAFEQQYYTGIQNSNYLSTTQLDEYIKVLQKSTMALGSIGGQYFLDIYNSVLLDNKDEFINTINSIDWANTSVAEASEKVKGIVDITSDSWLNYAESMIKAANNALTASESFDKLRKSIASINEIIKDLEIGEVISDEEYQKIIEKNSALVDSFAQVGDGWRVITDPEIIKTSAYNVLEDEFDTALEKAKLLKDYVQRTFNPEDPDSFYSNIELKFGAGITSQDSETGLYLKTDVTTAEALLAALKRVGAIDNNNKISSLLLALAGVSVEDYTAILTDILDGEEVTANTIAGIQAIYDNTKLIFDEEHLGLYDEENVLSTYTDLTESFTELNGKVLDHNGLIEDTSKSYGNFAAKKSKALNLTSKEVVLLQRLVKALDSVNDELKNNAEWVSIVAVQNAGMNQGLIDLTENSENYLEALSNNDFGELEGMFTSIKNIFDLTADEDPYDFIVQNWDLVQLLLQGNVDIVDDLQKRLAQTRLEALNLTGDTAIQLQNILNNTDFNMNIGSTVDLSPLFEGLAAGSVEAEKLALYINTVFGGSFWLDEKTKQLTKTVGSNLINRNAISSAKKGSENKAEEFDPKRYHEIDEVLDDISRKLDIIGEKKDKAFGQDKLAYFNQELKIMNQNLKATEEKLKLANEWYLKDRDAILKYGVELDKDGRIANYDEVRQRYYQQYASNPEAYGDSWNKLNEELDQYEETLNTIEDLEQEHLDLINQIKDAALEKIEYTITFNIESSEDKMIMLTRALERLDESAYDAADAIRKIEELTSIALDNFDTYKQGINDVLDGAGFTDDEIERFFAGDNTVFEGKTIAQAEVDKLREYRDNLIETENTLKEYRDAVYEQAILSFEEWNSKLDDNAAKIERCNTLLDEYKNIIDVVGADYLGVDNELLQSISDTRSLLATDAVTAAAASFKANQESLAAAEKDLEEAKASGDEDRIKKQQKLYDKILEETEATEEELMTALSNAMQVAADEFEAAVERTMDTLNEALGNIKELTELFEKQRELEELYLADHKKLYEINKLNRDIQKSIDETDNVKAQRELASISEEVVAYQASGAEMSKYDLEYLQKRYDLKKAEIALEEALNAKNQVKLQRDSKGNWGYVYTANQEDINKAQENYDKSLYEIQEFEYQSQRELTELYLDLQLKMMDELAALRASDFENAKEYEAKRQEIINHYTQMAKGVLGEIQSLTYQSAIVNKEYNLEMADTFEETLLGRMYPTYESFEEMTTAIDQAIADAMEALGTAYGKWEFTVDTAFDNAGISAATFADYMATLFVPKIQKTSTEAANEAKHLADEFIKYFLGDKDSALSAVRDFETKYGGHLSNVRSANDLIITSISGVSSAAGKMAEDISRIVGETNGYISDLKQNLKTAQGIANDIRNLKSGSTIESKTEYVLDTGDNVYDGIDGKYYRDNNGNWYHESDVSFGALGTDGRHMTFSGSGIGVSGNIRDISNWEAGRGTNDIIIEPIGEAFVEVAPYTFEIYELMSDGNLYKLSDLAHEARFGSGEIQYVDSNADIFSASPSALEELQIPYPSSSDIEIDYYDTGGYTGEWGADGRLAMLHQKEIVLNAHDTENFLAAVKIVRSMSDMLEHNAAVASRGLQIEKRLANTIGQKQLIEQHVTIEANFPGVRDRYEIEQAFNSLVNDAVQYTNRK